MTRSLAMAVIDLACPVPNNVGLNEKPGLRKSLDWFDVEFRKWWFDCGPAGIRDNEVYLRTPVGVDAGGWARYGFVPLSQYRWGVFPAPAKSRPPRAGAGAPPRPRRERAAAAAA